MKEVSNRTVVFLLIATIIISLGGTFISLTTINDRLIGLGLEPITGLATAPNATAILTIDIVSSIRFYPTTTIDFGTGYVNTSAGNNCSLTTLADLNKAGCVSFNDLTHGLTIENDGNTNLSVELMSNVSAVTFIGLSSALFLWNVTLNESGACYNGSDAVGDNMVYPNTTADCGGEGCGSIFENVSTSYKTICPRLMYDDGKDQLDLDINVTIPSDAPKGAKLAGLTVRGTRSPLT